MTEPSAEEIIYTYEVHMLKAEAILDLVVKSNRACSFLLFDIDGSREIRRLGIDVRLAMIRHLLLFVQAHLPARGLVFWYGNDELLLILDNNNRDDALTDANHLRKRIQEEEFSVCNSAGAVAFRGSITVSGGLVFGGETGDLIDLMRLARVRVAAAKERGRNQIVSQGTVEFVEKQVFLSETERSKLTALVAKKGRNLECLIREAVDTLLAHYPQFHGHRTDREATIPVDAYQHAFVPQSLRNNDT